MNSDIRIKSKIKNQIIVCFLFLFLVFILGILIYKSPSIILLGIYIILLILFGPIYLLLRKLLSNKSAVIISKNGIFENSSIISVGFIKWVDVIEVKKIFIFNQQAVVLIIKNKILASYIERESDDLKKLFMEINYQMCGTLVTIFENNINYDFSEFQEIVERKISESKV